MAAPSTITNPQVFQDTVTFTGGVTTLFARTQLQQDTLAAYPVPLTDLRVHDAFQTVLPGTAANDDLGILGTDFTAACPTVVTQDEKANMGAHSSYGRFMTQLPAEYQAGETVVIRCFAGMKTNVADQSAVIDIEAYKFTGDGGRTGGDICATSAVSINGSTTNSARDFTITASSLSPGDWLDVRVTITIDDDATGTAVIGEIDYIQLLCDIRG